MKIRLLLLLFFFTSVCFSQEICNNGIDDDGDGKIDLNDRDCLCGDQTPVPSVIPNASFENYSNCPDSFSQLDYCNGWIQATTATTDYLNTCGMVTGAITDLSSTLTPFPNGNGIAGALFMPDWNEYLGSCLLQPLVRGTNYQLTFYIASAPVTNYGENCPIPDLEPVFVTIYGTQDCSQLPIYTVISPDRASTEWVAIGKAIYAPQSRWSQLTINMTPTTDIKAIMIGGPADLPESYTSSMCYPYFLFDDLTLNESSAFDINIKATGSYCSGNLKLTADLSVTVTNNAVYQWYKEGVAIAGATQSAYTIPTGAVNLTQYSVRVTDGADCYTSTTYTINTSSPPPEFTIRQPDCISDGVITVNTLSDKYSFDNGATWTSNNVSGPLPSGTYTVKTKSATGCTSLGSVARLSYFNISNYVNYTTVDPLCGVDGNIKITSPAAQYSFDGGVSWQSDHTKNLPFGSYNLKIKDSLGCITGESYAYLPEPFMNMPLISYNFATCGSGGSITIDTPADFYSIDNGDTWSTSNTFNSLAEGYYYVKIKDASGCGSDWYYVYIGTEYVSEPYSENIIYCQGTDATALTAAGTDILWYDSPSGGTAYATAPIPSTATLGETWYYASQTIRQCEGPRTAVKVTILETPVAPTANQSLVYCQDEFTPALTATGTGLVWYTGTATVGSARAPQPPTNIAGTLKYYVCQSLNGCEGPRIQIDVLVHPTPPMPETNTKIVYKQFVPPAVLTATGLNIRWYDQNLALLDEKPVITSDELGETVYYVTQTINGCESEFKKINVTIIQNPITLKYPKFFTPNGDAVHEMWNVDRPDFGIVATINIFDRYGKYVTHFQSPGKGWDGSLNGQNLPSTDYWFTATYTQYGDTKEIKSHFSLIR
jgi:gliding motility-associated-like protein